MKNSYTMATAVLLCCSAIFIMPGLAGDTCSLTVLSIPAGGAVSIDGTLIGAAPLQGTELTCGSHTLIIRANGYADYKESVTLKKGNPYTIVANLLRLNDRGSVMIRSDPSGGTVFIDGVLKGTTPLLVDALTPGPHSVLIRKTNYEDFQDIITTSSGAIPEYNEALIPLPQTAFVGVSTTPDNATAYIDGVFFGITPTILMRVSAGNHTLLVQKEGYKNYTAYLMIEGGSTKLIPADLEKIPDEGTLIIDSSPTGAALYLNGTYKTVTPVTFEHIPAGYYLIEFQKVNYTSQNLTLTLYGDETLEVYALLGSGTGGSIRTIVRNYSADPGTVNSVVDQANVKGNSTIDRTFTWYSQGHKASATLHIPEALYEYYKEQQHPTGGSEMSRYTLSDEDRIYLYDLIGQLKEVSGSRSLTARNDYHNVVSFVQSIAYAEDTDPATGEATEYWKYPIETLADGKGDCEDTAILTAALLKEMDYDVAVLILPGHAAVGVACDNCNGYYYPVDGKKYYFLETTGTGFSLGNAGTYANAPAQVYVL